MSTVTKNTSITLDGSTNFKLGTDTYKWGQFSDIEANVTTSANHTVAYDLKGTGWNVGDMGFSGNSDAVITDHTTEVGGVYIDRITLYNTGSNTVMLDMATVGEIRGGSNNTISIGGETWVNDMILGSGTDHVSVTGDAGTDVVDTGNGNDTLNINGGGWALGATMGHGNDTVTIGKDDYFEAIDLQRDADTIKFAAGATGDGHINGGNTISSDLPGAKDFDTLDFSAFTKALIVDFAAETATATDVNYQIANFERVIGGSKGDKLSGASGADTLDGRAGNDTLNGRGGSDTFVFKAGYDADKINGFTAKGASHDVIDLSFKGINDFDDDLRPLMSNDHGNVVIDFGHGDTLTLTGVVVKDLTAADFHL